MASGWFIDDVELEIAPDTDERNISRSFQSETLFKFFPQLTKSTARAFDYTIRGIIYPESRAYQLDQIARSADTNIVIVTIPPNEEIFNRDKFAVKELVISRKGPLFTQFLGKTVQALPYTLTLTELPDEGEFQEGIDGFNDSDEAALGLQMLDELNESTGSGLATEDFGPATMWQILTGDIPGF